MTSLAQAAAAAVATTKHLTAAFLVVFLVRQQDHNATEEVDEIDEQLHSVPTTT